MSCFFSDVVSLEDVVFFFVVVFFFRDVVALEDVVFFLSCFFSLEDVMFFSDVVTLEDQWGDELLESKQADAAISHYIEAGKTLKALDAALAAKQWKKATQIVQVTFF